MRSRRTTMPYYRSLWSSRLPFPFLQRHDFALRRAGSGRILLLELAYNAAVHHGEHGAHGPAG